VGDRREADLEATEVETRRAVRNASLLVTQRGLDVVRALAFAALVPRLLGVEDFGRFALLLSVSHWFALMSGLGSTQLMGRFVPVMVLRDQPQEARLLLGNLLAVRIVSGTAAAATFLVLAVVWLDDLPLALVGLVAASVALRSVANVPFAFFLGLNEAARWGAGELTRSWASLVLVGGGAAALGLRGACVGALLAEVCVAALGAYWVRPHLSLAGLRIDRAFLAPHLRYNLLFFASNLLFALSQRGGEALVRTAGLSYAEVGYFGIAASAFAAATQGAWRLLMAFLPIVARQRAQGNREAMTECASRLLQVVTACGAVACSGAIVLGPDLVPLLVGRSFRPAAALLPPMAVAALFHAAGSVGRMMALALDLPRLALAAALVQTAVLVGFGLPLAERFGVTGVALAVMGASVVHAVVFLAGVRRLTALSLGPALRVAAIAGCVLALAAVPVGGLAARWGLFVALVVGFAAALAAARLVTAEDLSALWRSMRPPAS
jgi:O-antigen/teichoic acid export membrane protein